MLVSLRWVLFGLDIYRDWLTHNSLQWLALTPPILVKEHLGLSDETIASLNKTKQVVVGPKSN